MDVTCERCGTEYEFDETLLSARGTSVKCTNCGHVFKVFPQGAEQAADESNTWQLKLEDGSIDTIDSLRELQRRIASGELTPTNQIARGEESWKALGAIPELETFFHAAGVQLEPGRIASPPPPAPPVTSEAKRESSLPPGRRPRQPTLLGVMPVQRVPAADAGTVAGAETEAATDMGADAGTEADARDEADAWTEAGAEALADDWTETGADAVTDVGVATGELGNDGLAEDAFDAVTDPGLGSPEHPVPGSASDSYQSPYHRDSFADTAVAPPAEPIEDAEFEERPRASGRPSTPPPAYFDDDDDIPELPGRSSSPLRWLLLVVTIGALALVVTQWSRVARLVGIGSDPALIAAGIAEGDAGVAEGDSTGYADAIEAYGRAVEAGGDQDPEVLSKLSTAYSLAAQAQLDSGAGSADVAGLGEAALSTAQSAVELDPRDVGAKIALADALRLAGKSSEARSTLENARSMSFSRTAELYRVDARLSAAEAGGRLENGLRSARQAAELAPGAVPYLLLLARAEHAAGNDERAVVALETVLSDHPEHPVALPLLQELRGVEADPVLDAGVPSVDGGEAAALGETQAETETAPVPAADAGSTTESEAVAASPPAESPAKAAPPKKKPAPVKATAPARAPAPRKPSAAAARKPAPQKKPSYDEYDQLAEAAGSDEFVDGRPPVRDYDWYMKEGRAELKAGNYSRARAFFDSALEVRPGSAEAMDGLGKVATGNGDDASALRYFRVAAQRGHPDGYFNLGKTYEHMGRNEEAVSAYYTYVTRRPKGEHATAARSAIKALEPRAKLPPAPEADSEPQPEQEADPEPAQQPDEPPTPDPVPKEPSEEPAQNPEPTAP